MGGEDGGGYDQAQGGLNSQATHGVGLFDLLVYEERRPLCRRRSVPHYWRNKPAPKDVAQHMYSNEHWYGSLHGRISVRLETEHEKGPFETIPFEVHLQLHNVRDDGSCALYCLLQAARDASESPSFWQRFLQLERTRPRLVAGMQTLVQLSTTDTAGCPMLRWTLCAHMLQRPAATFDTLWKHPPASRRRQRSLKPAKDWPNYTISLWNHQQGLWHSTRWLSWLRPSFSTTFTSKW